MGVLWGLNVIDTFAQSRGRGHLGQVSLLVPKEFNKSPIKMIQEARATSRHQPELMFPAPPPDTGTSQCTLEGLILEWDVEIRILSVLG